MNGEKSTSRKIEKCRNDILSTAKVPVKRILSKKDYDVMIKKIDEILQKFQTVIESELYI